MVKMKDLQSLLSSVLGFEIDPSLIYFYQVGLGVGCLVITTLSFFPGIPESVKDSRASSPETQSEETKPDLSSLNKDETDETASPTTTQERQESLNNKDSDGSLDGFRQQVLAARRRRQSNRPSEWTPHQQLNSAVYLVLITTAIFILNYEYGNLMSVYLQHYFPREAAVLGIKQQGQP